MKKIILALFLASALISCESDDDVQTDPIPSTGNFKIDDDQFQLSQGFLTSVEEVDTGLYSRLVLLSSEDYNYTQSQIVGAADGVFLTVYSDNSTFEIEGTYSITDNQAVSGQVEMYFAINYDIQNDTLDQEEDIESGTLTISKNENNTYVFTINNGVVDIIGNDFRLDYDGLLTTIN